MTFVNATKICKNDYKFILCCRSAQEEKYEKGKRFITESRKRAARDEKIADTNNRSQYIQVS